MELFFGRLPSELQREQAHGKVKFWRYIEDDIEGQLDDPGDHFVGDLVRLHVSGEEGVSQDDAGARPAQRACSTSTVTMSMPLYLRCRTVEAKCRRSCREIVRSSGVSTWSLR